MYHGPHLACAGTRPRSCCRERAFLEHSSSMPLTLGGIQPQPPTRLFLPSTASTVAPPAEPLLPSLERSSASSRPGVMAAPSSPSVHISQCNGPNAFRIKGHFDATGEISCGKPVYRKRDGDYLLHFWAATEEWIIAGAADFREKTGASSSRMCVLARARDRAVFVLRSWLGRPGEFSANQRGAFPKRVAGGCRLEADHVCRGLCVRLVTSRRCDRRPCKVK